jgi:hypothetical protein
MQRTDNYDEEISSDNARAWDAFGDIWIFSCRLLKPVTFITTTSSFIITNQSSLAH